MRKLRSLIATLVAFSALAAFAPAASGAGATTETFRDSFQLTDDHGDEAYRLCSEQCGGAVMPVVERTRYLVEPGAGDLIWDGPIDTTVKVPTETTLGALSITEMAVKPGYMVPPHVHRDTDEWSYVLHGRIGARVGDDEFTAQPGSWILKPRGLMHTFWNAGPEPARIIELLTPGAFEHMFRRMADLAARDQMTDERLDALAVEFGTTIDMAWVPDLAARYGLEVTL